MKITFLNSWLFCAAFLLFSCDSSKNKTPGGESGGSEAEQSSKADRKTAKCLAEFDYDYSKLLTKEDVLKHVPIDQPEALELKYDAESVKKRPEYGKIRYTWPSERPDVQTSPSVPVKRPDLNSVSLSNLEFKDGDISNIQNRFHAAYRSMSQEQVEAGKARMKEFYKDKPAEDLENAIKLLEKRAEMKNTPVEGLGDFAYWFPFKAMDLYLGAKVVVLVGNAQFEVVVKVDENDEENFEVAKKIVTEVLAKCKG